ncbi:MAG: hypothetical protein ABSG04_15395 [Verrucomicrobiota bacterium]|jgi:hypothetical protein
MIFLSFACEGVIFTLGNKSGVVVFDRWGGCYLYSGVYFIYVSEKVKEGLRPYVGQAIQIDVKGADQPMNPGDAIINKFEYRGAAPDGHRDWVKIEGIRLTSSVRIRPDGKAVATIIIENTNRTPVKLLRNELALTVLRQKDEMSRPTFDPFDGPSIAVMAHQPFGWTGGEAVWEGGAMVDRRNYGWTIGKENALPREFTLGFEEKRNIDVELDLPDGQYDFLCGYGGDEAGKCVASNLTAFDVQKGKARVVDVKIK